MSVNWDRLWEIFHEVREAPEEEREALVRKLCKGNDALLQEVVSLLETETAPADLLDTPTALRTELLEAAREGERVGRYTVLGKLGEGGSGSVYRAQRTDGELDQEVALKLLRPDAQDPLLLERFEQERTILSRLSHPNIARVLDAGRTDEGAPFVVLELIDGVEIDRFCNEGDLNLEARLRLFGLVCEAVDFAHRNFVVHRDIKPGNILVRPDGTPKLLDFGIAKFVEPSQTTTKTVARLMTPRYASPEQLRGEPVSTASDVYSLGVVLYELLTRRSPYGIEIAEHEWIHHILETEPDRPSTSLSTDRATRPDTAGLESIDAGQIRGDLDAIVLRALAKEPERRYSSAAELRDDIQRFRDGQPVKAQPDSRLYRARRFLGRHRLGVAAAVVIAASVIVGTAATTVQSLRLSSALERETEQRRVAEESASYLVDLIESADPALRGADDVDLSLREVLLRGATALAENDQISPSVRARVGNTLVRALNGLGAPAEALDLLEQLRALDAADVGRIEHSRLRLLEGQMANEASRYVESRELLESLVADLEEEPLPEADSVEVLVRISLASAFVELGSFPEARSQLARITSSDVATDNDRIRISVLDRLARTLLATGQLNRSESAFRQALEIGERGDVPDMLRANTLKNFASLLMEMDRYPEALAFLEESAELMEPLVGPRSARLPHHHLGVVLHRLGRHDEAHDVFRRALDIKQDIHGRDSPLLAYEFVNFGWLLHDRGLFHEALPYYEDSLRLFEEGSGSGNSIVPSLNNLGLAHLDLGQHEAARPHFDRAIRILIEDLGPEHVSLGFLWTNLARLEHELDELDVSESLYRQALAVRRAGLPPGHIELGLTLTGLGGLLCEQRRFEEGETLLREALEIRRAKAAPHDWRIALTENELGACLAAQGVVDEGRRLIEGSIERIVAQRGRNDPRALIALERAAALATSE